MAGLKEIKNKINSVKKTRKVTRAMEAVSAVKMRKSQERALSLREYARSALRILGQISAIKEFGTHPLVKKRSSGMVAILLITSDKGLAGSLNSGVIKIAENFANNFKGGTGELIWFCVGKRAVEWAGRRKMNVYGDFTNMSDDVTEEEINEITRDLLDMQYSGKIREAHVIYTNFKSTFEQEPIMRRILPISENEIKEIVANIIPERGKYADLADNETSPASYKIEPSKSHLLNDVLPILINIFVLHTILENKASEHSARMVAMKNASDKAGEIAQTLKREFNKARQAAITAEISEITSGLEAMK